MCMNVLCATAACDKSKQHVYQCGLCALWKDYIVQPWYEIVYYCECGNIFPSLYVKLGC